MMIIGQSLKYIVVLSETTDLAVPSSSSVQIDEMLVLIR